MRTLALAATLALLSAAPLVGARPAPRAVADAHRASAGHAAEVRRIRAHFDSVLAELPGRAVGTLTPAQRARRAALLDTLRAYRDRGDFPHNRDFPGRAVPYFVDRATGTMCAVGYLLAASGRRDVVNRVAAADNNVWVPALASDTAFASWLDASGLTLAEAARIQVPYVVDESPVAAATRSPTYTGASAVALGGAAALSVWNARANARGTSRAGTVLGVTSGVAAVGLGALAAGSGGPRQALGAATLAAGVASVWVSTRGLRRHRSDVRIAAVREREAQQRASIAPILPVGREGAAGAMVAVRF